MTAHEREAARLQDERWDLEAEARRVANLEDATRLAREKYRARLERHQRALREHEGRAP